VARQPAYQQYAWHSLLQQNAQTLGSLLHRIAVTLAQHRHVLFSRGLSVAAQNKRAGVDGNSRRQTTTNMKGGSGAADNAVSSTRSISRAICASRGTTRIVRGAGGMAARRLRCPLPLAASALSGATAVSGCAYEQYHHRAYHQRARATGAVGRGWSRVRTRTHGQ